MPRLSQHEYISHLRDESRRFRTAIETTDGPDHVPSCPDWTADDLLWHLARVQWFWGTVVRNRPVAPSPDDEDPGRPGDRAGLLAVFDQWHDTLAVELASAEPDQAAWTWSSGPGNQSIAFILRRQAHEALVHRLDAELAAGQPLGPIDVALASDGVHEVLDVMYGGCPSWGTFTPGPHVVAVRCVDTGDAYAVRLGHFDGIDPEDGREYVRQPDLSVLGAAETSAAIGSADVTVSGPAAVLDAWLWHRADESSVDVTGDLAVWQEFLAAISEPID